MSKPDWELERERRLQRHKQFERDRNEAAVIFAVGVLLLVASFIVGDNVTGPTSSTLRFYLLAACGGVTFWSTWRSWRLVDEAFRWVEIAPLLIMSAITSFGLAVFFALIALGKVLGKA